MKMKARLKKVHAVSNIIIEPQKQVPTVFGEFFSLLHVAALLHVSASCRRARIGMHLCHTCQI